MLNLRQGSMAETEADNKAKKGVEKEGERLRRWKRGASELSDLHVWRG